MAVFKVGGRAGKRFATQTIRVRASKLKPEHLMKPNGLNRLLLRGPIARALRKNQLQLVDNLKKQRNFKGFQLKANSSQWVKTKRRIVPRFAAVRGRFSQAMMKAIGDKAGIKVQGNVRRGWKGTYGPAPGHPNTLKPKIGSKPGDALDYLFLYEKQKAGGQLINLDLKIVAELEQEIIDAILRALWGF